MKNINIPNYLVADIVKTSTEVLPEGATTPTLVENTYVTYKWGNGQVTKRAPYSITLDAQTQSINERRAYTIYTKQDYPRVTK